MTPTVLAAGGLVAVALFCLVVCAGAAWAGRHLREEHMHWVEAATGVCCYCGRSEVQIVREERT